MATAPRIPPGNDPRRALGSAELEAASQAAYPQVAGKASRLDVGMLSIVAAALGIGAVTWIALTAHQPVQLQVPAAPKPVAAAQISAAQAPAAPAPAAPAPAAPVQPVMMPASGPPFPRSASGLPSGGDAHAPVMIIDNSTPQAAAKDKSATAQGNAPLLDSNEQFAARFSETGNTSSHIADPSQTIPQGAVIPAVLETALNSDLPGFARAFVSRDVKGFDGTKVLVPRGARLIGQYRSGLSSGVTRAFVIWERLIRPDGVSIQLGSPATDEIGQVGVSGDVDTHFLKRFGAAMLLSVVTGLSSSNSGAAIVIGTSGGTQNAAADALGVDAKIPPTIRIAQGTVIQVFVAHDLHFGE